jgi:hypothetical protein
MQVIDRVKTSLQGLKIEENPALVKQKSRDFFWYSPVLKRQLEHVTADIIVMPQTAAEVERVLAVCFENDVPLTVRGTGTGNYGQSSLRRVDLLTDQATGVGARWRDVTLAGLRPEMRVLTHEPGQAWAEEGRWRGLTAYLALTFVPQGGETDVEVLVSLTGSGWWRLPALVTGWVGPAALRSCAASAASTSRRRHFPSPTSTSVPTRLRTW